MPGLPPKLIESIRPTTGRTLILPHSSFTADAELFVINVGQAFRPAAGFLAGSRNAGRKPGGSPKGLPHKNRRSAQRLSSLVVRLAWRTHSEARIIVRMAENPAAQGKRSPWIVVFLI